MKKSLLVITALTVTSCSSIYRRSESIAEKMDRYRAKEVSTNKIPKYSISKFKYKKSRRPASSGKQDINLSNKNLYFVSLYAQYESFAQIYPEYKRTISQCPVFHQPLLSYKEAPKKFMYKKISNVSSTKGIVSSLPGDTVREKIEAHMKRNKEELDQLCMTGSSDNYYIYENLITLIRNENIIRKDKNSVNSLLKTSIFFNEALLSNIGTKHKNTSKGRSLASSIKKIDYGQEAIRRVKASWAISLLK